MLSFQSWPALRRGSSATLATIVRPAASVKTCAALGRPSSELKFLERLTTQSHVCTGAQLTQVRPLECHTRLLAPARCVVPPWAGRGLACLRSHA